MNHRISAVCFYVSLGYLGSVDYGGRVQGMQSVSFDHRVTITTELVRMAIERTRSRRSKIIKLNY